eukprot:787065-Rhodomonas_salina.1
MPARKTSPFTGDESRNAPFSTIAANVVYTEQNLRKHKRGRIQRVRAKKKLADTILHDERQPGREAKGTHPPRKSRSSGRSVRLIRTRDEYSPTPSRNAPVMLSMTMTVSTCTTIINTTLQWNLHLQSVSDLRDVTLSGTHSARFSPAPVTSTSFGTNTLANASPVRARVNNHSVSIEHTLDASAIDSMTQTHVTFDFHKKCSACFNRQAQTAVHSPLPLTIFGSAESLFAVFLRLLRQFHSEEGQYNVQPDEPRPFYR